MPATGDAILHKWPNLDHWENRVWSTLIVAFRDDAGRASTVGCSATRGEPSRGACSTVHQESTGDHFALCLSAATNVCHGRSC